MNKNQLTLRQIITLIIIFLFVAGVVYLKFREQVLPARDIQVGNQIIKVELAQNPFSWKKGLSGRSDLAANSGMLFIFATEDRQAIWMKDMKFPIDIIWINNGAIIDMAQNVEPTMVEPLPVYLPRLPARMVLEVKAGMADKNNWKIGEIVGLLTK